MIYATVGTQLPFDRLVSAVDWWAELRGRNDVFMQIGQTMFRPQHAAYQQFLDPLEAQAKLESASLIISHAGMGTIISALELGKPIIVLPRRAGLGEHRNDHQLATVKQLSRLSLVTVAMDEQELLEQLDHCNDAVVSRRIGSSASEPLIGSIREFLQDAAEVRSESRGWRSFLGRPLHWRLQTRLP